jgi:formate--tetrahydrofolate ligase
MHSWALSVHLGWFDTHLDRKGNPNVKSDLEIARSVAMRDIDEVAAEIGLAPGDLVHYGRTIGKVPIELISRFNDRGPGKLILVSAMTPTSMGEGKTTNTIGLAQALRKLGRKTMVAIREPSLGPCMGVKGGAAGGGFSQVLPMEDINLHFTGDIHAVSTAHNLLAALLDNHLHHRNAPEADARRVVYRRVLDMNDRSLRSIVIGLQGEGTNGVMREDGFEITAASEVMAILCLARSRADLKERLSRIIVGYDRLRKPVTAGDIGAQGSMAALLKYAIMPNLVQTVEGAPVFVHGGPFGNIAHGCNSVIATSLALKLADYTVTEAGFGADLGAEKFFHIKCRSAGLNPAAVVLVITRRACAVHGVENAMAHAENLGKFGMPVVILVNRFADDGAADLLALRDQCRDAGYVTHITDYREAGGAGGLELAQAVVDACEQPSRLRFLYELSSPLKDKVEAIARGLYGADGVDYTTQANSELRQLTDLGFGDLPVCMAKTQSSLSDDPKLSGRPRGFRISVASARVSAGAGFVVVTTGKIMTMPGLPRRPAALDIDIDDHGNISGLF